MGKELSKQTSPTSLFYRLWTNQRSIPAKIIHKNGLKNQSLSFIMKNDFMKGSENK